MAKWERQKESERKGEGKREWRIVNRIQRRGLGKGDKDMRSRDS